MPQGPEDGVDDESIEMFGGADCASYKKRRLGYPSHATDLTDRRAVFLLLQHKGMLAEATSRLSIFSPARKNNNYFRGQLEQYHDHCQQDTCRDQPELDCARCIIVHRQ